VPILLQPQDDHPEDRTEFAHPDLPAHVAKVRPLVLGVLLGMIELWKQAGRPLLTEPRSWADEWTRVVGGIMQTSGFDEWLGNLKDWRGMADSDGEELRQFVAAWWAEHNDSSVLPKDLYRLAEDKDLFGWTRTAPTDQGCKVRFASTLRKYVDRPVGQWVIRWETVGNAHRYRLGLP